MLQLDSCLGGEEGVVVGVQGPEHGVQELQLREVVINPQVMVPVVPRELGR